LSIPGGPVLIQTKEKKTEDETSRPRPWRAGAGAPASAGPPPLESLVLAQQVAPGEPIQPPATAQPPPILPDDRVGDEVGVVILINARTGQKVRSLRDHKEQVDGLIFSPDGRRMAALSQTQYQVKPERRTVTRLVPVT